MSRSFDTICVVGLGLLGGSLAAAVRSRRLAQRVVGVSRREETARRALERGMVDEAGTSLGEGVAGADLIVLATPVFAMEGVLREAAPRLRPGALVTDVGSVKGPLVDILPGLLPPGLRYVGSHPMAGSHASGIEHARADLFEGAACVVAFWQALGARVELRGPGRHDEEVAWVSHLPHVLAFAYARSLRGAPDSARALRGAGFRDFTRVARSEPELWADILVSNRKAIAGPLEQLERALHELARCLESGDPDAVAAYLSDAREQLACEGDAPSGGENPEIQVAREAAIKE